MQIILALFFLGLIQGLTEFLPVSSSGHLVLFSKIFGIEESLLVSILLHVATLLSIIVVFHKDVWQIIRHPFSKLTTTLVVATIPTCLIVLILMPLVKASFSGFALPVCFVITAAVLLLSETLAKKNKKTGKSTDSDKNADIGQDNFQSIDYKTAFFMGVAQGFAVFPGISRSGSTISAGLLSGKDKKEIAKFSFLMSIPVILLSLVMEVYDICTGGVVINVPIWGILLSCLAAFAVGVFAIKVMIKLTEKSSLKWFSYYLVILSVVSLFIV